MQDKDIKSLIPIKLLLFDLDGTLLRSDKRISERTLTVLQKCREKGLLIGISTARSEQNSLLFISGLSPDIIISSGGALVRYGSEYIFKAEFSIRETGHIIQTARKICGEGCEITIDTTVEHYWNYKTDPREIDPSWGDSIYTDYKDFSKCALKICVEIPDPVNAEKMKHFLPECDCIQFSDGDWYKFTPKTATKESAILELCSVCSISPEEIIAFGDDFSDIGMLRLCGTGIAMGNAIKEVKDIADQIIGSNDEDGIAEYLMENI